jgi:hypothetical protein
MESALMIQATSIGSYIKLNYAPLKALVWCLNDIIFRTAVQQLYLSTIHERNCKEVLSKCDCIITSVQKEKLLQQLELI